MNSKALNWSILIALALIWGSSFILMKRGLDVFTSDQVAAYRIFIAFIFVLPLAFRHLKREHLKKWGAFLGMGLFGNFLPAFLFTKAETGISSALTGMLNSLTPLFTLLLGVFFFGASTRWVNAIGVLVGLCGAVGLLYAGAHTGFLDNLNYGTYVLFATLCYGLSVNIIKKFLNNVNSVTATIWAMCFIGPPAGIYLFCTDFTQRFSQSPFAWQSLGCITVLGVLGTALSVMIFNVLIKNTSALFASSVTYLIPIVAIGWGIQDGEEFTALHGACIVLILAGVWLVNRKPLRY